MKTLFNSLGAQFKLAKYRGLLRIVSGLFLVALLIQLVSKHMIWTVTETSVGLAGFFPDAASGVQVRSFTTNALSVINTLKYGDIYNSVVPLAVAQWFPLIVLIVVGVCFRDVGGVHLSPAVLLVARGRSPLWRWMAKSIIATAVLTGGSIIYSLIYFEYIHTIKGYYLNDVRIYEFTIRLLLSALVHSSFVFLCVTVTEVIEDGVAPLTVLVVFTYLGMVQQIANPSALVPSHLSMMMVVCGITDLSHDLMNQVLVYAFVTYALSASIAGIRFKRCVNEVI